MKAAEIKAALLDALDWPDNSKLTEVCNVLKAAKILAQFMVKSQPVSIRDNEADTRPVQQDELLSIDVAIVAEALNHYATLSDHARIITMLFFKTSEPSPVAQAGLSQGDLPLDSTPTANTPATSELVPLAEPIALACAGCAAPILKIKLVSGSWMPVEAEPINPDGKKMLVFLDGTMGRAHRDYPGMMGYFTHFAGCPKSKEFSKRNKAKTNES